MDSKKLSELDPKLKEIYDRVMGTSVKPAPQSPTPSAKPLISNPTNQEAAVSSSNFTPPPPNTIPVSPAFSPKISPLVWILGVVAFIVIYALVWVKIFNLKLPFLP